MSKHRKYRKLKGMMNSVSFGTMTNNYLCKSWPTVHQGDRKFEQTECDQLRMRRPPNPWLPLELFSFTCFGGTGWWGMSLREKSEAKSEAAWGFPGELGLLRGDRQLDIGNICQNKNKISSEGCFHPSKWEKLKALVNNMTVRLKKQGCTADRIC